MLRRGEGHHSPTKELSPVENCSQGKTWFSPTAFHWVYKPHLRAGLIPSSRWPTQINSSIFLFVCFLGLLMLYLSHHLTYQLLSYILWFPVLWRYIFLCACMCLCMYMSSSCFICSIMVCLIFFVSLFSKKRK